MKQNKKCSKSDGETPIKRSKFIWDRFILELDTLKAYMNRTKRFESSFFFARNKFDGIVNAKIIAYCFCWYIVHDAIWWLSACWRDGVNDSSTATGNCIAFNIVVRSHWAASSKTIKATLCRQICHLLPSMRACIPLGAECRLTHTQTHTAHEMDAFGILTFNILFTQFFFAALLFNALLLSLGCSVRLICAFCILRWIVSYRIASYWQRHVTY